MIQQIIEELLKIKQIQNQYEEELTLKLIDCLKHFSVIEENNNYFLSNGTVVVQMMLNFLTDNENDC